VLFVGIGLPTIFGALLDTPNETTTNNNIGETDSSYTDQTQPELIEPSDSPNKLDSNPSVTYYLAINSDIPAPENPIPVADYQTMQALVEAAENGNQEKYTSLLNSSSVSLVYGGGIVFILDKKDGLVQVEVMGKSVNGDISGQTRWTSEKFIQFREF
jgi:hypothetical protein